MINWLCVVSRIIPWLRSGEGALQKYEKKVRIFGEPGKKLYQYRDATAFLGGDFEIGYYITVVMLNRNYSSKTLPETYKTKNKAIKAVKEWVLING